ncbi:MAG: trypsin-like peptidase domain-containing protein [bacterium]|nr:trypsin-like peptidase domain-containing protein [bacterium]
MNQRAFISLKIQIIILAAIFLILALQITALILYERGELYPFLDKIFQLGEKPERQLTVIERTDEPNKDTQDRIKELEEKIKELEEKQNIPFPEDSRVSLNKNQISAIVQLWCPDDNYNNNGFMSLGSGTIISPDGIIITNRHVISNYNWSVIVSLPTCYVAVTDDISQPPRVMYSANLIAYSPGAEDYSEPGQDFDFDIAFLYIDDVCQECEGAPEFLPASFPYLEMGYSDLLDPGDYVAIAGYPGIGADTFTFTEGIVSGRVGDFVIKTDAKIDSGNSGGSALNGGKELIGVPTWTISGQAESLGYVIGIDQIVKWYEDKVVPSASLKVPY